ncbi:MAG: hypothetical protein JWN01_473 [Patescibacteria group bacterium]|nr:hypothetical protein [Patescibacteria group bacterium]
MRQIDTKYQTSGDITKLDGTPIPADEPLMLFRGRDKLLPQLLDHYKVLRINAGSSEKFIKILQKQIDAIKQWQANNPDRIRIPD